MDPDKTTIYFGPPGTGKTHKLLDIVHMLLDDGFESTKIMFIAFTRKAANEAKDRAMQKFKLHPDLLPWFRTLHSLAFHQLGMTSKEIMGYRDYCMLAGNLGLSLTIKGMQEDGTLSGLSRGDRMFFMENMARATKKTLKDLWEESPQEDIYWYELERVQQTYIQYKKDTGKVDFTDVITGFIHEPTVPDHRVLIVDEVQDLTPLQYDMIEVLAKDVEEIYMAGDDDQAIFRWAGADVDRLITMPGTRVVLEQSYRCPGVVQKLANEIASRMTVRVAKNWKPRNAIGVLDYVVSVEHLDLSQGTWLLLARNVFFLEQYSNHCLKEGFVFESQTGSPIRSTAFRAIRHWEELRKGETITVAEALEVYDYMSTNVGVYFKFKKKLASMEESSTVDIEELKRDFGLITDKIWHIALDKINEVEREYFLAALRRGEKLLRSPRIKISTIHGAKGGEADNVVLCVDMAPRTWVEYQKAPDDEHRVWYVAVTRAREKLFVLRAATDKNYVL